MKSEYDFSKGERGKFFRTEAETRLPIYLDADVQSYLSERAADKGIPLGEMVNGLLKREIQIMNRSSKIRSRSIQTPASKRKIQKCTKQNSVIR